MLRRPRIDGLKVFEVLSLGVGGSEAERPGNLRKIAVIRQANKARQQQLHGKNTGARREQRQFASRRTPARCNS
jgi:hypothetical protein